MRYVLLKHLTSYVLGLLFIVTVFSTENYLNKQSLYFSVFVVVASFLSVCTLLIVRSRNRIVLEDYLVMGFALWLTINYLYISPINVSAVYWGDMFVLATYGVLRVTMPEYRCLKHVVFIILLCLLLYEAFFGIMQAFRLVPSGHGMYLITGSFLIQVLLADIWRR